MVSSNVNLELRRNWARDGVELLAQVEPEVAASTTWMEAGALVAGLKLLFLALLPGNIHNHLKFAHKARWEPLWEYLSAGLGEVPSVHVASFKTRGETRQRTIEMPYFSNSS